MISVPQASHKTNAVLIQGMDTLREINKIQLTSLLYISTIHKSNCYDLLLCMCISVTKSMAHMFPTLASDWLFEGRGRTVAIFTIMHRVRSRSCVGVGMWVRSLIIRWAV